MNDRRLVLIPGLATDARVFARLDVPGWEVCSPPWLLNEHREPLEQYAGRLAPLVREMRPDALGGHSMGGILAIEVARRLGMAEVLLISSAASPDELPPLTFVHLRRMLAVVSDWLVRPVVKRAGVHALRLSDLDDGARRLSIEMFQAMPLGFTRWAIWAMSHWRGEEHGVRVRRLHGAGDRVLPAGRRASERVIEGAGHLLPLTHPGEVSAWLAERLRGTGDAPPRAC